MQVVPTNCFNDNLGKLDLTLDEKYGMYRETVYHPDKDTVQQYVNLYRRLKKKEPRVLREDFCGIHDLCGAWVAYSDYNHAYAVDIDREPLDWGKENPTVKMNSNRWDRLHILNQDCRHVDIPNKVDFAIVGNWSQQILRKRTEMVEYFKSVYSSLKDDGIFLISETNDLEYGPDAHVEERNFMYNGRDYKYAFETQKACYMTHLSVCKIHFYIDNKIATPFEYPWRVWTIAEYLDILEEVGFEKVHFMMHCTSFEEEDELSADYPPGYKDTLLGFYDLDIVDPEDEDSFAISVSVVAEKKAS